MKGVEVKCGIHLITLKINYGFIFYMFSMDTDRTPAKLLVRLEQRSQEVKMTKCPMQTDLISPI